MIGQSVGDGDPAPVGERSDDKSGGRPKVLIAIVEEGSDLFNETIVKLVIPVVSQLLLPLKIHDIIHISIRQFIDNVPVVDLGCDQCHYYFPLNVCQVSSDHLSQLGELGHHDIQPLV